MSEPRTCPECGNPLPAASPHGLCPACLLKRGLEPNTLPNTAPSVAWAPPSAAEIAPRFPELDILRLVGRGGMGAVYQARQKNLHRDVALKILPPEIGRDPSFTERFSREAQSMARLNHPHIVTIYEFGERQSLFYFLMEFVDGVSLRQLLSTGHVTPKEALAIVPQICEALQYAHEQGIVHRDIKPENILINKQGQVKIADFGLAKLMGQNTASPRDTAVAGTPQYMAPEQLEHPADVDHRADIYSLGVVFYQMLTGELPTGRFAAPSKKVQIDVRLDEIVLKALEREPEKRYQEVSQVQTEVTMITQTPWRAAYAQSKAAPSAEGGAAGGAGKNHDKAPRFSRKAIVGAAWAPLVFIALLGFTVHREITVVPGAPPLGPAWWQYLLMFTLVPLGLTAPFGTTILGAVALSQIRHSAGRLYGLGLALADTLLFPLLALDVFLVWLSTFLGLAIAYSVGPPFFPPMPWGARYPAPFLGTMLAVTLCLISNVWIIRASWRSAKRPLAGDQPEKAPPRTSPVLAAFGALALVALAVAVGIFGDYAINRSASHARPAATDSPGSLPPTPRLQFHLERPPGDTTSAYFEYPNALHPHEPLKMLTATVLDQSAIADAAFDPSPLNDEPAKTSGSYEINLFLTPSGSESYARIPHVLEHDGPATIDKTPIFAFLDGRLLRVDRFQSHPILDLPAPATRADAERIVASLKELAGVPISAPPFRGVAEILAGLPADARPDKLGWDEFSQPKADRWLEQHFSGRGRNFISDVTVRDVTISRISPKGQLNETLRWNVDLVLQDPSCEFNSAPIKVDLGSYEFYDPNATTFTILDMRSVVHLSGDEAFARRAKTLKPSDRVTIGGVISKTTVEGKTPPKLWVLLSDPHLIAFPATAP